MSDEDMQTIVSEEISNALNIYFESRKEKIAIITYQWANLLSSSIIPRDFYFRPHYKIKYTIKSTRPHKDRIKEFYIPQKPKTKIGSVDCDLIIQTSYNAVLYIELKESKAIVYEEYINFTTPNLNASRLNAEGKKNIEKKNNLYNRIEVMTKSKIRKGDIYRIGRTDIVIYRLGRNNMQFIKGRIDEICISFYNGNKKIKKSFSDSFYICRKLEDNSDGNKVFINDVFIAKEHAFVSKNEYGEWMIQNLNEDFITWKYFVTSTNENRFSPIYPLMINQRIHMNGSRVWLEEIIS